MQFNGRGYTAFHWTQGDNPKDNSGEFEAWIDNGTCNDSIQTEVEVENARLIVSPNPAVGFTELKLESSRNLGNVVFEVYEMATNLKVRTITLKTNERGLNKSLNLSGLKPGIYFVKAIASGVSKAQMVIVR